MNHSSRLASLVDASDPTYPIVPAIIKLDLSPFELEELEKVWASARNRVARQALIEHSHWDWRNKIDSVKAGRHRIVGLECHGECQGVMALLIKSLVSKLSCDPLLYVDYIEAAPWNLKGCKPSPAFLGVGAALIREAIRFSHERGLGGRIGLHSLPQAEEFYAKRCEMTRFGNDPDYYDLVYFEYTELQAREFIERGGETLP